MEILIQNSQEIPVNLERIQAIAQRSLQAENCADDVELSVVLTDDEAISELNKVYRDIDGPTDVLSFAQAEGEEDFDVESEEKLLGDVVISVETAKRQAEAAGNSMEDEIDMLLVHGILHLLGYDHAEPEEAEKMFSRQAELLR